MKGIKIVLFAVIASLMFVGCGNNAETPSEIAKKVLAASINFDFATLKKYVVKERIEEVDNVEQRMAEDVEFADNVKNMVKGATFKILSETIDGNSAVVIAGMFTEREGNFEEDIKFVKVNGEWKIDSRVY